jgi:predicted dehydrogenase
MYSALILGCGNIGALYDLNQPAKIWTHAKAFSKAPAIQFTVSDENEKLARKIARVYGVEYIPTSEVSFKNYDIVSIATPTATHFSYLSKALKEKVPLILCEKPVAIEPAHFKKLKNLYEMGKSRVLVNYMRRFQPAYKKLKDQLSNKPGFNTLSGIIIKYQRGLLNNGGHAFDLLEYLFDVPFDLKTFRVQQAVYDAFPFDPTVSGSCLFNGRPVLIVGVANATYPVFEIELFFPSRKVVICHSGNEIRYYIQNKQMDGLTENKGLRESGILAKYMSAVIGEAISLLNKKQPSDNFLTSLELNRKIVEVITSIRRKSN